MNEPNEQPNNPRPPVAQLPQRTVAQLQTTEAAKTAPQERLESPAAKPVSGSAEPVRQRPPSKSVQPDDECLSPRVREAYERRQAELAHQEEIMFFFRRVGVSPPVLPRLPFSAFLQPAPEQPHPMSPNPSVKPRRPAPKKKPPSNPPPRKQESVDIFADFRPPAPPPCNQVSVDIFADFGPPAPPPRNQVSVDIFADLRRPAGKK